MVPRAALNLARELKSKEIVTCVFRGPMVLIIENPLQNQGYFGHAVIVEGSS